MAAALKCESCRLVFPIGTTNSDPGGRDFWLINYCACRLCGTPHAVKQRAMKHGDVTRLFYLENPICDDDSPLFQPGEKKDTVRLKWYIGPPDPEEEEWLGGFEIENDKFYSLDVLSTCCNDNTLLYNWLDRSCPSCNENLELIGACIV